MPGWASAGLLFSLFSRGRREIWQQLSKYAARMQALSSPPPRAVHDLHVSAYHGVETHTGAQALMRAVVSLLVGKRSLCPCPGLTRQCRAWLQANQLTLSFRPDGPRSLARRCCLCSGG